VGERRTNVFPTHHFHQELARARYADMLREARKMKVEAALEADVDAPVGRLRRVLARRGKLVLLPLRG
jgi:hypothetical protein